jgi:putative lipoic acid-binding regulatory protein
MQPFAIDEADVYPATHHFRIIVAAGSPAPKAIESLLADYTVTSPLQAGHASAGGRYQSLQVAVHLTCRADHLRLDQALRAVEGVRILL